MQAPSDVKQLKRFLGMISYLSKFLPAISLKTELLRKLDRKDSEWTWTTKHQQCFEDLKEMVCRASTLQYFDLDKEITI